MGDRLSEVTNYMYRGYCVYMLPCGEWHIFDPLSEEITRNVRGGSKAAERIIDKRIHEEYVKGQQTAGLEFKDDD